MQARDLPHAVLAHVTHFGRAFAPVRILAELAGELDVAPGAHGRAAIGGRRDHRHHLQVFVEATGIEILVAIAQGAEIRADVVAAAVDAVLADLQLRLRAEQLRGVVPLAFVEVVAVGALQALDVVDVLQALRANF